MQRFVSSVVVLLVAAVLALASCRSATVYTCSKSHHETMKIPYTYCDKYIKLGAVQVCNHQSRAVTTVSLEECDQWKKK